jgi:aryl-alcohol dehydrogenase-like predicted oxidoreductase
MPRFQNGNLAANLALLPEFEALAAELGASLAQISLAWVLAQGAHVLAIPGTTSLPHLRENAATCVTLTPSQQARLGALLAPGRISGPRYAASTQAEIDTEEG